MRTLAQLDAHPGAVIHALDSEAKKLGFAGRPDLLLEIEKVTWQFEFKRLTRKGATRLLEGHEISQFHARVKAALKRVKSTPAFPTASNRADAALSTSAAELARAQRRAALLEKSGERTR